MIQTLERSTWAEMEECTRRIGMQRAADPEQINGLPVEILRTTPQKPTLVTMLARQFNPTQPREVDRVVYRS